MARRSLETLKATLDWYFKEYHRRSTNLGTADTFTDASLVGPFAVSVISLQAGEARALLKVLIACTFFQKRQDQQVLRILRRMRPADVRALTDAGALRRLIDASPCECLRSVDALADECGLTKDGVGGAGTCQWKRRKCHLKQHTVLMKRYGHFGKIPSSVVLMLRENGVDSLPALRRKAFEGGADPVARAYRVQEALMRTWRISSKISAMFLSAISNPDLSRVSAPWQHGIAWDQYVVVDSNTDRFLSMMGVRSPATYDERRQAVVEAATAVDLRQHGDVRHAYNPRLVQQAMYAFMGMVSRRANPADCCNIGGACGRCPRPLRLACPVRAHPTTQS